MKDRNKFQAIDRREFVLGASAAAVVAANWSGMSEAHAKGADDIIKKITGGAKVTAGKVTVKLPEIAENGNTVPYTVTVDSPMTDKDHVKEIHVIATGNPTPLVATYKLSPASGKAKISSRMRMAKTQDIVVVAQLSNGSFVSGKKNVKVTIGGCGGCSTGTKE